MGRALAHAVEESSLRIARTRAIRAEIESGTYETPARIAATAARVLDVIG
jgi:anti-sigma28 factor (negative regulator of flagellin synthesis)